MKKILLLLCTLLLISSFTISTAAKSNQSPKNEYDYTKISDEDLSLLDIDSSKSVVKVYGSLYNFGDGASIEEVISNSYIFYVVTDSDGNSVKYSIDDGSAKVDERFFCERLYNYFYKFLSNGEDAFKHIFACANHDFRYSDVEINEAYFFNIYMRQGMFIYFVTNHGDFIFYRHADSSFNYSYLIPIDIAREAIKVRDKYYAENPTCGGVPSWENEYDLRNYAVDDFNLMEYDFSSASKSSNEKNGCSSSLCILPIGLATAVATGYVISKKKGKKQLQSERRKNE